MNFYLQNPTPTDLQNAIQQIIGNTSTNVGDGRLQRILPLAHPVFPFWYASNITSIRGAGQPTQAQAFPALEASAFPNYLLYPRYEFTVEFSPRDYAVLADSTIVRYLGGWNDSTSANISPVIFTSEWLRYTDFTVEPQFDTITTQLGQQVFKTQSGSAPGGSTPAVFAAMPKRFLPNQLVKFVWRQVPYRYITSPKSYIGRYPGNINQNPFYIWPAGSLLYLGFRPFRYTPPIPQLYQWVDLNGDFAFTTQKLCNIEFNFLLTTRTGTDVPAGPNPKRPEVQAANSNWIAAGHNLQPWFKNFNFYYTTVQDSTPANQVPSWFSFPFELLFTDPDAVAG